MRATTDHQSELVKINMSFPQEGIDLRHDCLPILLNYNLPLSIIAVKVFALSEPLLTSARSKSPVDR